MAPTKKSSDIEQLTKVISSFLEESRNQRKDYDTRFNNFEIKLSGYNAQVQSQSEVTNINLKGISDHLARLNSKVASHEKIIADRAEVVSDYKHFKEEFEDIPKQVRVLEDNALTNQSIKKFMGSMFAAGIALGGLIISIISMF